MKGENVMRYRGWLLPPALRDFHEGRIWLKDHSPFSAEDIDKAIQRKYVSIYRRNSNEARYEMQSLPQYRPAIIHKIRLLKMSTKMCVLPTLYKDG